MTVGFTVNGVSHSVAEDRRDDKLIDFLHDDLNLTGTKLCCGIAICRACTVSVKKPPNQDATPSLACSTPLWILNGAEIKTIEGVASADSLTPIQDAFLANFAFQCGYCTPGFVIAAQILVDRLAAAPTRPADLDAQIEYALGGHICRCTGYVRYFEAAKKTAEIMLKGKS
ncbi:MULTISPECIES: (2Fe-2S)-binding protein [Bradyrhizobium]|uniref:(2Fe-2S)-binding protein n=1 Tax=Bradyrhizobium frederickii TaxID=2560054 RepID=A0A4Y9NMI0_9BRAD|nr:MULTISPECIES: (2Fe-2S)-binding protein [Bradyrhizobium]RTE87852.1 (2Fe-2S)-binding protein [Bradyrhizobium sp. LVM 105]TFV27200.1 (2Fe-2S)-binding protein [Bradyrhizobium frederickii]TFV68023.1 (2Fe-2S)-binding protein [Bradyrhizobium frederickii]